VTYFQEGKMETISGFVEHIVYRNEDNGYTVLNLVAQEDEITCVGIFHVISEGESIEAEGEYTVHPSYGQQFKIQSYKLKAPEDLVSIERYLDRSSACSAYCAKIPGRYVSYY
jgi:exodeoxyribonuclease V alpha subunit